MNAPDIENLRKRFFPFLTPSGVTVRAATSTEVNDFVKLHFNAVFPVGKESNYFQPSEVRRKGLEPMLDLYHMIHHEWFLFISANGEPVGWHMGEAEDYVTFYLRNTGILPSYRGQGIYKAFSNRIEDYLQTIGYERLSSHHQSTNRAILISKLKSGFAISGLELTERWGALVKVVKLLPKDRRESYYRQFGMLEHL